MLNNSYIKVLREAQSKSKQKEYGIPKEKYPKYLHDTDDLDYFCVNALFNYSSLRAKGLEGNLDEL